MPAILPALPPPNFLGVGRQDRSDLNHLIVASTARTEEPKATRLQALTEKEKQTLRLIVRGHDAKSMARQLGLSVHTVNERLREARRKLEVSSSREAARLLHAREANEPKRLADKQIGEDAGASFEDDPDAPGLGRRTFRPAALFAGAMIMTFLAGIFVLSFAATGPAPVAPTSAATESTAKSALSPAAEAARAFLELGDQSRWSDSYAATSQSFRAANTLERWTDAAVGVRKPMGALIGRTMISDEDVPMPPAGGHLVKFQSDYAKRSGVIEKISLIKEGGSWKVVGIYVE